MNMIKNVTDKISILYQSNPFKSTYSSILLFLNDIFHKIRQLTPYNIAQICIIIFVLNVTYFSYQRIVYHNIKNSFERVRIAHCMTGVPRTLYKEEVYMAYRRHALNILPGDLFVVLQLLKKNEEIHGITVTTFLPERYNISLKYLSPRKIEWITADDHLGAIEDRSGYGKWQRCLQLIEEAEKENGVKYDYIIRSRPDLYFVKDLPTSNLLPKDRILINPYYECLNEIPSGYNQTWPHIGDLCDPKDFGVSDLFAIIPRSLADPYMRVGYTPDLPRQVCGGRANHPECAIKAALYKANITYEMWPFIVKIMRSAEFCRRGVWNQFNSWC